ncbi:MAG: SwmB domain-containing protein [Verrucomicrobiota bacterium]|nr:SwmB domain-containing protein [Verrucomicrobiota bacterium]
MVFINTGTHLLSTNNPISIEEGDSLYWSITGLNRWTRYYYTISGIDILDITPSSSLGGSFSSYSPNASVSVRTRLDSTTEGPEIITLKVYSDSSRSNLIANKGTILIDTSRTPPVSITAASTISEGDSLTWNITNLIENQTYYYRITGTQSDDNTDGLTSGSYTGGTSHQISITTTTDRKTEGTETIKLELYTDQNYTKLAASASTILNDTSKNPQDSITAPIAVNEGDRLNWTISDLTSNQDYYYLILGIGREDINSPLWGSFRQSSYNTTRDISITALADQKTEGPETIKFELYTDAGYTNLAATATTTLNDTSTSPVITVNGPSESNEGDGLIWRLRGMVANQYYYYRITGIDNKDTNSRLTGSFRQSSYGSSTRNISITTLADKRTEGNEAIKFELFTDSSYKNSIASATTTLKDTSTTPIVEISGPSEINEGDRGTFNLRNLQTDSYYYRLYDPSGKFSDSDASGKLNGSFTINSYHSSTATKSISLSVTADQENEGPEKATFELYDNSTYVGNPIVSKELTINDTSTDQSKLTYGTYTSQNNPSVVNEGESLSFNLSNLGNATYYWKFEGIDTDDISGSTSGQFRSYQNGFRQIPLNIKSDDFTEGVEKAVFIVAKDQLFSKVFKSATFSIADTSQDPKTTVNFSSSRIRSNEGESANIDLAISSFPRSTTDLYWELSGSGLTKFDLATRFGDLSELIDLKNHYFRRTKYIRGTEYSSGSYSFKIPFSSDKTTEGTETYQLKIYDNQSLTGNPLAETSVIVYDTSLDSPKSDLNTATINNKTINLFFSAPIDYGDISSSYFEIKSQDKNLPVDSVKLNSRKNAAAITLQTEPEVGSTVNIVYKSSSNSILQSFDKSIQVDDVETPVPISGIAYATRIELRFSEKLNTTQLARSAFDIRASNRAKKIDSIDVMGDDGIVIINLKSSIDINDDLVEVDYYDFSGNQSSKVLEDYSGNDVNTFKNFSVVNEVSDTKDISVVLAEAEESIITLGFDIEIDGNSVPNNGMFRVSINGNKSKIKAIQLSAKKREAYLELKNPITNGDTIKLTYIDAKGNQKDNIIQSKYGGDLGTFKNLSVDNLSSVSYDPPDFEDAYYDSELSAITLEFDEIISGSKIKNSRFKIYSLDESGKKKRSKVADVITYEEDTIVEIMLKSPIEPSAQQLFMDYRDPKGDQIRGVIEDLQGNDLLSVKRLPVEFG